MKMYFDKFSEIGSTHKENEDFAVVGDEDHPFIIVSDGCSGSKDTGIGSRLLCLTAAKIIRDLGIPFLDSDNFGSMGIKYASDIANFLQLPTDCLDATLMIAYTDHYNVTIHSWGDGYVFYKYKDGLFNFFEIQYIPEAPYYLSYQIDEERNKHYKKLVESNGIMKSESFETGTASVSPLSPTRLILPVEDLEYVVLSTDGVSSFINKHNAQIDQRIINIQVNSFKRLNGEFITRRIKRMMKENAKEGISHYDDFTVAGISFVEED